MGISPPIQAASLGMADSLILMVLALVVFGPRRLPQIGRQIGKLMYEFRKASSDFKFQMEEELRNADEADRRKREEADRQRTLTETQKAAALAQSAAESALNAAAEIKSAQTAQSAAVTEGASSETPAVETPAEETAPTETGLLVQPPSTGEQVAAERPGGAATDEASAQEPASQAPAAPSELTLNVEPAGEEQPASESSAHHG